MNKPKVSFDHFGASLPGVRNPLINILYSLGMPVGTGEGYLSRYKSEGDPSAMAAGGMPTGSPMSPNQGFSAKTMPRLRGGMMGFSPSRISTRYNQGR